MLARTDPARCRHYSRYLCDFGIAALLLRQDEPPLTSFAARRLLRARGESTLGRFPRARLGFLRVRRFTCRFISRAAPAAIDSKLIGGPEHEGEPHGYNGTSADVWSLGATLFEALVGARAFDCHWLPAYENYRGSTGPKLLARLLTARAAVAKLVLLQFTESQAQPTHSTGVPEREPAAGLVFPAVEVPVYEGEATPERS